MSGSQRGVSFFSLFILILPMHRLKKACGLKKSNLLMKDARVTEGNRNTMDHFNRLVVQVLG